MSYWDFISVRFDQELFTKVVVVFYSCSNVGGDRIAINCYNCGGRFPEKVINLVPALTIPLRGKSHSTKCPLSKAPLVEFTFNIY